MDWDFYDILKISKMSFDTDIKRAYKRCVAGYNTTQSSEPIIYDKFRKATIAYHVLSNPEYRKTYDLYGYEGLKNNGVYVMTIDFMKIYNTVFQQIIQEVQQVDDGEVSNIINMEVIIPLNVVYVGEYKTVVVHRKSICNKCHGTGADDCIMRACKKCQGRGRIPDKSDGKPIIKRCDMCNGIGVNLKNRCIICDGKRTTLEDYSVTFMIPVGVSNGEEFIIKNQGNIMIGNNARDNIVLTVKYADNSTFRTMKQCPNITDMCIRDLCVMKTISLASSMCNKTIYVELLNGMKKEIKLDHIIKQNDIITIDNAGLPEHGNPTKCGKLFIVFQISYPKRVPDDKIDTLYELLNALETVPDGK